MALGQKLQFMKLAFYFATVTKVAVNGKYNENSIG